MTFYGAIYWPSPETCLDDAFDAPDAWGSHDPLTTLPPPHRRYEPRPRYEALPWPVEPSTWKPKPKPKPKPPPRTPPAWGTIELTCDECGAAYGPRLDYGRGQRDAMAAGLRAIGAENGWTHINGRDRCPECSAPEDVGNGAGERDHDKQYTNGG